jgi:hypothetical protein
MRRIGLGALALAGVLCWGGCGGDSTTVINNTVIERGTARTTPMRASVPADAGTRTCGELPGAFPSGPPMVVTARGLECVAAMRLARQAIDGSLPAGWRCAAGKIACKNGASGASFRVDDNTPAGAQYCPKGLLRVGDDACGLPPPVKCRPNIVQNAGSNQVPVYSVRAQNVDCAQARALAKAAVSCGRVCESRTRGFICRPHGPGGICTDTGYRVVRFKPAL